VTSHLGTRSIYNFHYAIQRYMSNSLQVGLMPKSGEDGESNGQQGPREGFPPGVKRMIKRRENVRIGPYPGAGPSGAKLVSYQELPDDTESLKHMYLELQRTLQDLEAKSVQEKQELRFGGETDLDDLLSRFWNRGWELVSVVSVLAITVSLLSGGRLSQTQQLIAVIIFTSLWERYLREPVHSIGKHIDREYIP